MKNLIKNKLHLNLMCRNMNMSNVVENEKPPLPKGRGTTEGGGGIYGKKA